MKDNVYTVHVDGNDHPKNHRSGLRIGKYRLLATSETVAKERALTSFRKEHGFEGKVNYVKLEEGTYRP